MGMNERKFKLNKKEKKLKDCSECDYYEENGIMFSAVPECMKHKEYASAAAEYCDYLKKSK